MSQIGCHDNFRGEWAGGPRDNVDRHDNFGPHDGWDHR
jgi:hypothetical protein